MAALRLIEQAVRGWAYFGCGVLVVVVLLNAFGALAGLVLDEPFAAGAELTKMGVAVAAFAFLPYCQLTFANASAVFFTAYASKRVLLLLSRANSLIAMIFSAALLWHMSAGLMEYRDLFATTDVTAVPIWYAFVPIVASIALLLLACAATFALPQEHQAKEQATTIS